MQSFNAQFAHPQDVLGRLVGVIMAIENRERNRWAISLLGLQPMDHVLEVGFGPGWAIAEISTRVPRGQIVGVDASETMVAQAARRNKAAVRAGRVILKQASATNLPFNQESFDKVLTVNSLPFWDNARVGMNEIRRVLKPGGRVVVTLQPVWAKTNAEVERVTRELYELVQLYFSNVRLERQISKMPIMSVIGEK